VFQVLLLHLGIGKICYRTAFRVVVNMSIS
jgi:hypothetical protein